MFTSSSSSSTSSSLSSSPSFPSSTTSLLASSSSTPTNFSKPELWKCSPRPNQYGVHNIRKFRQISSEKVGELKDKDIFPVYEEIAGWVNVGIGWCIIHATGNSTPSLTPLKDPVPKSNPFMTVPTMWKCHLIDEDRHNIRASKDVYSEWRGSLEDGQEFPVFAEERDSEGRLWVLTPLGWTIITAIGNVEPSISKLTSHTQIDVVGLYQANFFQLDQYNVRESRSTSSSRCGALEDGQIIPILQIEGNWAYCGIGWIIITPLREVVPHLVPYNDPTANPVEELIEQQYSQPLSIYKCTLVNQNQHNIRREKSVHSEWMGCLSNGDTIPVFSTEFDTQNNYEWAKTPFGYTILTALGNSGPSLRKIETPTNITQTHPYSLYQCTTTLAEYNIRKSRSTSSDRVGQLANNQIFTGFFEQDGWINVGFGWVIITPLRENRPHIIKVNHHINHQQNPMIARMQATGPPSTWIARLACHDYEYHNIRKEKSINSQWVGWFEDGQEIPVFEQEGNWIFCGVGWAIIQPDDQSTPSLLPVLADEEATVSIDKIVTCSAEGSETTASFDSFEKYASYSSYSPSSSNSTSTIPTPPSTYHPYPPHPPGGH